MERRLKERLTGAAVLVMLAVIFIPMVLDNSGKDDMKILRTNIPSRPETDFGPSRIIPLDDGERPPLEDLSGGMTGAVGDGSAGEMPEESETPAPTEERVDGPPESGSAAEASARETPPAATPSADTRGLTAWVVQLGSFSNRENAEALIKRLQNGGYAAYIEEITTDSGQKFRVRVGPELAKSDAEGTLKNLEDKFSLKGIVLEYP